MEAFSSPKLCSPDIKSRLIQFRNCRLLRRHQLVNEDLWAEAGRILDPEKVFFDSRREPDLQIDCRGAIISPGFIDVQVNGAFGCDFTTWTPDFASAIVATRLGLLAHGVTAICPTVISSRPETYAKVLPFLRRAAGSRESGAALLGTHLEGPFISQEKRGCHPPASLDQDLKDYVKVYGGDENLSHASIVTLAPELPGAIDTIRQLSARGIRVSLGHSAGNLTSGEAAFAAGAASITHLFCAMLSFHHRDPGLVGLLTSAAVPAGALHFGVIADGVHTHDAALRIAHRTAPAGLVLVTDATAALGFGDGVHKLGDVVIQTTGHKAVIQGSDRLAGRWG